MASRHIQTGGASASPNVLPFPQTDKALRRRREGMGAAGNLALQHFGFEGMDCPANVERIDRLDLSAMPEQSPEILLALTLFCQLPAAKQERAKRTIRAMAFGAGCPHAVKLINLLSKGK